MSDAPKLPIRLSAPAAELAAVAVQEYVEGEARLKTEQTRKLNVILKDLGLPLDGQYNFVGKGDGIYVEAKMAEPLRLEPGAVELPGD